MDSEIAARLPIGVVSARNELFTDVELSSSDSRGHPAVEEPRDSAVELRTQDHPSNSDVRDEILLEGICKNDREMLSTLFRRYAPMVRTVAERILRDPAEAEDLVQEVFLFVFRKARLFDPTRGSARSWLVQVSYHRAFDRRRHLASRRVYSNLELEEAILHVQEPAMLSASYDDTIEAALGRDALRRMDDALSDVQRQVIRLHFFDGYTVQEIAAILGQSPGNIRNHYYRALDKMRREVFAPKLQGE
jgi:RNA polymerase sigma-70 factor (ECF subfamily)